MLKPAILDSLFTTGGPAAFGRLCVETSKIRTMSGVIEPAAFGRLCVETVPTVESRMTLLASRLRAAVC